MCLKYKKGDKVRVRCDLNTDMEYVYKGMLKYKGQELVIYNVYFNEYRVKSNSWKWTDDMLEPLHKDDETIGLEIGNKVLVSINGRLVGS